MLPEEIINDLVNNVLNLKRKHEYFNNITLDKTRKDLVLKEVISICNEFNLKSKSRQREILYRRYFAMYLLHEHTKLTFEKIGLIFGRGHATVLNALTQVKNLIDTKDPFYLEAIEPIYNTFNGLDFLTFIDTVRVENIDVTKDDFNQGQLNLLNQINATSILIVDIYTNEKQ